jgi:hypothetical protein
MTHSLERPLGLRLLTWLLGFWAGASVLVIIVIAAGDGPVPLRGEFLPRDEAVARFLTALAPMALAAAGAALALALEKHWARSAVLLPFALVAVAPVFTGTATSLGELAMGAVALAPIVAAVVWYLFFRPKVTAYFDRLRESEIERRDAVRPDAGGGRP